jgi:hypothetical protein
MTAPVKQSSEKSTSKSEEHEKYVDFSIGDAAQTQSEVS